MNDDNSINIENSNVVCLSDTALALTVFSAFRIPNRVIEAAIVGLDYIIPTYRERLSKCLGL